MKRMTPRQRRTKTDDLYGNFACYECGEQFSANVWHCPYCDHHWMWMRRTCWNCYKGKRPLKRCASIDLDKPEPT